MIWMLNIIDNVIPSSLEIILPVPFFFLLLPFLFFFFSLLPFPNGLLTLLFLLFFELL
jgi:hypothetical protein